MPDIFAGLRHHHSFFARLKFTIPVWRALPKNGLCASCYVSHLQKTSYCISTRANIRNAQCEVKGARTTLSR